MTAFRPSRRAAIAGGLAASAGILTSSGLAAAPDEIPKKQPGETRVLFLGGDQLHNFVAQERGLRSVCERAGWKFLAVHDARYVTADFVAGVDLMMVERYASPGEGWLPGPVYAEAGAPDTYMSPELEEIIVGNVTGRGMAFMSIHCTIWALRHPKFLEMLGINPIIHGPLQTVRCHRFNQDHPITRGMQPFEIALDENFGVEIVESGTIPLYEVFGMMDKRQDYGGWCTAKNKGRVVGLLAGHTYFAFQNPNYLELFRRGAWWALGREIPPSPSARPRQQRRRG